jgi:chemotaxis signal transduction protein
LALDAVLVGEVVVLEGVTPLPGCPRPVLGLANLRGRALAVVDLGLALGDPDPGASAGDAVTALVLRLPGCEVGLVVARVDGVFAADPTGRRSANRAAEPPWIAGFQHFQGAPGQPALVAAVIDPAELAQRLDRLRFSRGPAVSLSQSHSAISA